MKSTMKIICITLVAIIMVALLGTFMVQGYQNRAISLEEQVEVAKSDINVQEKRRVDLIYNLADCVKHYDKHEAETLISIAEGRVATGSTDNVTTLLNAVSEAYPELKSNENYKELMNELAMTENLIAEHRSNYNKQVKHYKQYIRQFPNSFLLNLLGYETQDFAYLEYDVSPDAPQDIFGE